ncbi:MAG: hypothetical protein WA277_06910, partial [Nitrospirota bacterium]
VTLTDPISHRCSRCHSDYLITFYIKEGFLCYFLFPYFSIIDPGINPPKGEHKKALRTRGEKLIGEGWVGDSVEKVWINIILNAIDKKINSLNEQHFKTAGRYELLIYDNSHVAEMVNIKNALPLLKNAVFEKLDPKSKRNFHSISVIHGNKLLYDITNKVLILKK